MSTKFMSGFMKSVGNFGIAAFLLCVLSGVILAIPFDVTSPFESVSLLVLINPWASLFRNMHYWSAQLFTVFTIVHVFDHLRLRTKFRFTQSVWLRLIISVLVVFFVMITGFILKGDADSQQARRILESLLLRIPYAGSTFSLAFLGKESDFQIIYVHHIATATIFLFVVIHEHARTIWTNSRLFIKIFLLIVFLSYFLQAPLHDGINPVMKGPWYFIGLQEFLHWLRYPEIVWIFTFIILAVLIYLPRMRKRAYRFTFKFLIACALLYALMSVTGIFFRGENWKLTNPLKYTTDKHIALPVLNPLFINGKEYKSEIFHDGIVKRESCMACHSDIKGLSLSHNPESMGCAACHGGNVWATSANMAHRGMKLLPGNLSDADYSCGNAGCHPEISSNIHTGLMTTLSGMISVDKWVFDEIQSPDIKSHVQNLKNSAADEHLKNLCTGCHLGVEKIQPGLSGYLQKGGGCLACHLEYTPAADKAVKLYYGAKLKKLPGVHPNLTVHVSDDKCFTCHNRSGRISTNYEGWSETLLDTAAIAHNPGFRIIEGHRVFERTSPDIHQVSGMGCIDCHNSYELMGDGKHYKHEENQVNTACIDCHSEKPETVKGISEVDHISQKIIGLNSFLIKNGRYLKSADRGRIYVNAFVDSTGNQLLITKNSNKSFKLKSLSSVCNTNGSHKNLSCNSCHAAWAPTCLGCHTTYENQTIGFDHQLQTEKTGTWTEQAGIFKARPPTLGVRINKSGDREIIPFVPGMVLSIDRGSFIQQKDIVFKRLFAPVSPHTTSAIGRTCKSCHNNPVALGYGDGELKYLIANQKGTWQFTPEYAANKYDGLPEDAWIQYMTDGSKAQSTRLNHRAFTIEEQQKILTVGACLTCHDENSITMGNALKDWAASLKKRKKACVMPSF